MKRINGYIIFYIFLMLLLLPVFQKAFHVFSERPLNGDFILAEKPVFTWKRWFSGEFQGKYDRYQEDHNGFRNFLVRSRNQIDFTFFRKADAEGVVIGKNTNLFEYDYIRAYTGKDYMGKWFIDQKLKRAKYVQEYLKKDKGIDFVIVYEPGKASFYPEDIPDRYAKEKLDSSNYKYYIEKSAELGIRFLDLNKYFLELKSGSKYPLFPRYGTHWSVYGMTFAADSLLKYIESSEGIDLSGVKIERFETSRKARDTDEDVLKTMNLLFPLPGDELAYPVYSFDTTDAGDRPMVLAVADSYYWNIFNTGIPKYLFANEAFWYFNSKVYPDTYLEPTSTSDLDLKKEIEKQNVIFLMVTERFMFRFDWSFIDQLYYLYAPFYLRDPVYDNINRIASYAPWLNDILKYAEIHNISPATALFNEAKFLYLSDDTAGYFLRYGQEHFANVIRSDLKWRDYICKKAVEKGIPAEEMLKIDADYIFKENYPGLFEISQGINAVRKRIETVDSIKRQFVLEAQIFGFDENSYIQIKAEKIFEAEETERIADIIRNDSGWLGQVNEKAIQKGLPLDSMIRLDAVYIYQQKRNLNQK